MDSQGDWHGFSQFSYDTDSRRTSTTSLNPQASAFSPYTTPSPFDPQAEEFFPANIHLPQPQAPHFGRVAPMVVAHFPEAYTLNSSNGAWNSEYLGKDSSLKAFPAGAADTVNRQHAGKDDIRFDSFDDFNLSDLSFGGAAELFPVAAKSVNQQYSVQKDSASNEPSSAKTAELDSNQNSGPYEELIDFELLPLTEHATDPSGINITAGTATFTDTIDQLEEVTDFLHGPVNDYSTGQLCANTYTSFIAPDDPLQLPFPKPLPSNGPNTSFTAPNNFQNLEAIAAHEGDSDVDSNYELEDDFSQEQVTALDEHDVPSLLFPEDSTYNTKKPNGETKGKLGTKAKAKHTGVQSGRIKKSRSKKALHNLPLSQHSIDTPLDTLLPSLAEKYAKAGKKIKERKAETDEAKKMGEQIRIIRTGSRVKFEGVYWFAPQDDSSVPTSAQNQEACYMQILAAIISNDNCREVKTSKTFVNRWGVGAQHYTATEIQSVAWDIVDALVGIHTNGWTQCIRDSHQRDIIQRTMFLTFQERFDTLVQLLTHSKTTCADLMKEERFWAIIGNPGALEIRTASNKTSNQRKGTVLKKLTAQKKLADSQVDTSKNSNKTKKKNTTKQAHMTKTVQPSQTAQPSHVAQSGQTMGAVSMLNSNPMIHDSQTMHSNYMMNTGHVTNMNEPAVPRNLLKLKMGLGYWGSFLGTDDVFENADIEPIVTQSNKRGREEYEEENVEVQAAEDRPKKRARGPRKA